MATLDELARQLNTGALRARDLVEAALDRIAAPTGEGARAFISINADSARARADAVDRARAAGQSVPAFAGIPIALKDLFDVAGEVTSAGSRLLQDQPAALRDAPVIGRLRADGFIFIGRNNMTEFAYSGLGQRRALPELLHIRDTYVRGGIPAAEAYAWHRPLLERSRDRYDPRVANRILKGRDLSDRDVRDLYEARAALMTAVERSTSDVDAIILPTTPIVPPPLTAFEEDVDYVRLNALVLRNPCLANFLDRCSISLPVHRHGEAPVGLMLFGRRDGDERLFAIARAIESATCVPGGTT